jgi:hypothetical protein
MERDWNELIKEQRRELAMRKRVYPAWVAQGKLDAKTAEFRIQAIEQTIEILEECKPKEPVQVSLFGEAS